MKTFLRGVLLHLYTSDLVIHSRLLSDTLRPFTVEFQWAHVLIKIKFMGLKDKVKCKGVFFLLSKGQKSHVVFLQEIWFKILFSLLIRLCEHSRATHRDRYDVIMNP